MRVSKSATASVNMCISGRFQCADYLSINGPITDMSYLNQAVVAVLAAGVLVLVVGTYSQRVALAQGSGVNAVSKR